MSISDKDRKMLWALSKNRCAICACPLVVKSLDKNLIVGEECHIVSKKTNGPRHRAMQNYDTFNNIILLCPQHHKIIDEDTENYTEEKLFYIKLRAQGFVLNDTENLIMFKIDNPIDLFNYINGAEQYAKSFPKDCVNDYPLFKEFYDLLLNDFDLLNGEIDEFDTASIFKDILTKLNNHNYCILATVKDNFGVNYLRTAFIYIMKKDKLEDFRYKGNNLSDI